MGEIITTELGSRICCTQLYCKERKIDPYFTYFLTVSIGSEDIAIHSIHRESW